MRKPRQFNLDWYRKGLGTSEGNKVRVYQKNDGLSDNSIQSVVEDQKGDLWIGTEFGGINRMSSGKFTSVGVTKMGSPVILSSLL